MEIAPGDRVAIGPMDVLETWAPDWVLGAKPGENRVTSFRAGYALPWSDGLPAVSRWLAAHDAATLAAVCRLATLVGELAGSLPGRSEAMAAAESLLAALAET